MRFNTRSLLAWIKVAIAGGDPLGRDRAMAMSFDLAEAGPDDRPGEHHVQPG